jgi:hypothetical protein
LFGIGVGELGDGEDVGLWLDMLVEDAGALPLGGFEVGEGLGEVLGPEIDELEPASFPSPPMLTPAAAHPACILEKASAWSDAEQFLSTQEAADETTFPLSQ